MPRLLVLAIFVSIASAQIQVTPLFDLPGETSDPVLSPDGKTLAFDWTKPDYTSGIYARPLAGGDVRLLATAKDLVLDGNPIQPLWSPDSKRIAFNRLHSRFDQHLAVLDLVSGRERDFGLVCDRSSGATWSPDGEFLAASVYADDKQDDCRLGLFSAETGARVRFLASSGIAPVFSPDGRSIAYSNGRDLMLVRLDSGYHPAAAPTVLARELRDITGSVHWSADGKEILYALPGSPRRISISTGARPEDTSAGDPAIDVTEYLPGGMALGTETIRNSALWRADLRSSPPQLEKVPDHECAPGILNCSPDGRHHAIITTRGGNIQIAVTDADGSHERAIVPSVPLPEPDDPGGPNIVGWSPDGKWIAFAVVPSEGNADNRAYLYIVPSSGGMSRRLGKEADALDFPVWSRDSKSLYASRSWNFDDPSHRNQVQLVRVSITDGTITPLGAGGIWPHLSPDGRFLYFSPSIRGGVSRIPANGGQTEKLLDGRLDFPGAFVGTKDLYYLSRSTLMRFDLNSRQSTALVTLPFNPRPLTLSADEHFLYLGQQDLPKRRAVLVRGLK